MANKIIQLKDKENNNLYPISVNYTDNKIWVPDYNKQETINRWESASSWTVNETGFVSFALCCWKNDSSPSVKIKVNGKVISIAEGATDFNGNHMGVCGGIAQVSAGDVVTYEATENPGFNYKNLYFIPGKWISQPEDKPAVKNLIDLFYPIGSYYETSDATFNPNTAWGGTWVEDTAGRVLVSQDAGTFNTVGDEGGAETHTLTVEQMPSHRHVNLYDYSGALIGTGQGTGGGYYIPNGQYGYGSIATDYEGGGKAHNNIQPYIVVKRWHRTA